MTRVKICGLTRVEDARAADRLGAAFVGAILSPGYGRSVGPQRARTLFSGLTAQGVAVFVDPDPDEAARAAERAGARVIQLHGSESPDVVERIRGLGRWRIWKVLRVRGGGEASSDPMEWADLVDGLLFDAWHPRAAGGVGLCFDWSASDGLRGRVPPGTTTILAGGLEPGNVRRAIEAFRPDVVDVSSGVEGETRGVKDPRRLGRFIRNASTVVGSDGP